LEIENKNDFVPWQSERNKKSPFFRKMKLIFLNKGSFMKITAHISARMLITFLFFMLWNGKTLSKTRNSSFSVIIDRSPNRFNRIKRDEP